jgi:hypothetical protein
MWWSNRVLDHTIVIIQGREGDSASPRLLVEQRRDSPFSILTNTRVACPLILSPSPSRSRKRDASTLSADPLVRLCRDLEKSWKASTMRERRERKMEIAFAFDLLSSFFSQSRLRLQPRPPGIVNAGTRLPRSPTWPAAAWDAIVTWRAARVRVVRFTRTALSVQRFRTRYWRS